jgi:acyl-CoA thioester hydrolase
MFHENYGNQSEDVLSKIMRLEYSMPSNSIQIRVPFADVDKSGRIHFTAMLRYMDIAEHELMRALGFPRATAFPDLEFPRVHVSCDYHRAICYDDVLTLEAHITHVGRSSWSAAFTTYYTRELEDLGPAASKSVATGQLTIVAIDKQTERATPLPDELRTALVTQLRETTEVDSHS